MKVGARGALIRSGKCGKRCRAKVCFVWMAQPRIEKRSQTSLPTYIHHLQRLLWWFLIKPRWTQKLITEWIQSRCRDTHLDKSNKFLPLSEASNLENMRRVISAFACLAISGKISFPNRRSQGKQDDITINNNSETIARWWHLSGENTTSIFLTSLSRPPPSAQSVQFYNFA